MKMAKYFIVLCLALLQTAAYCQQKDSLAAKTDSLVKKTEPKKKDSAVKKKHDPGKATLYSAICPGLGQIYNKKYWKLPLVYAALGIPAYTYTYNKSWYKKCQYALAVITSQTQNQDSINRVDPKLRYFVDNGISTSVANYRDEFRRDQDYSALFFLLFWGLNIVDATVDAHLKDFNVNSDLSLHIEPTFFPGVNAAGISFVFNIHKGKTRLIDTN